MFDNYIYNNIENNYNYNSNQNNFLCQASPNPDTSDLSFDLSIEDKPIITNNLDNNFNSQYFLINDKIPNKIYKENNDNNNLNNNLPLNHICPKCSGLCSYKKKQNYRLNLECRCGYKKNYSIIEYEDISKDFSNNIRCMICPKEIGVTNCYYCIRCKKDLCYECINNHYKEGNGHKLISFAEKHFFCLDHGEKYSSSSCISCKKKNLCPQCESEHNEQGHETKSFDIRPIERELEELKNADSIVNEIFNYIFQNFFETRNKFWKAINSYTLILNSNKKYRNQETFNRIKNFKLDFIKDFKKIIKIYNKNNINKTFRAINNLANKFSNSNSSTSLYPKKNNIPKKKKKVNTFQMQSIEKINITSTININESEILQQKNIKNESRNEINSLLQMLNNKEIKNFEIIKNSEFIVSRVNSEPDNQNYINIASEININRINNSSNNNFIDYNNINEPIPLEQNLTNNYIALENQENLYIEPYIDINNEYIDKSDSCYSDNYYEENDPLEFENLQLKHSNIMFLDDFVNYDNFSREVSFQSDFKDQQNEIIDKALGEFSSIPARSSSNVDSNQYNDDSGKSNWFTESSKEKNKNIINRNNPFIIKVFEVNLIYKKAFSLYNKFVEKIIPLNNYLSDLWNKFLESFYYYKSNYFDLYFEMITKQNFWNNLYIKSYNSINNFFKENSLDLSSVHKRIIKKNDTFFLNSNLIKRKKLSFGNNIKKLNNVHRLINININQTKRKYNFSNLFNSIICYGITQNNSGLISINHHGNQFNLHILISRNGNKIICIVFLFNCVVLLYRKKDRTHFIYNFPFGYECSNINYRLICLFMKYFFHLSNVIK